MAKGLGNWVASERRVTVTSTWRIGALAHWRSRSTSRSRNSFRDRLETAAALPLAGLGWTDLTALIGLTGLAGFAGENCGLAGTAQPLIDQIA